MVIGEHTVGVDPGPQGLHRATEGLGGADRAQEIDGAIAQLLEGDGGAARPLTAVRQSPPLSRGGVPPVDEGDARRGPVQLRQEPLADRPLHLVGAGQANRMGPRQSQSGSNELGIGFPAVPNQVPHHGDMPAPGGEVKRPA